MPYVTQTDPDNPRTPTTYYLDAVTLDIIGKAAKYWRLSGSAAVRRMAAEWAEYQGKIIHSLETTNDR